MKQYLELLKEISLVGDIRGDRTGTGTRSVFGRQIKFGNIWEEFPLVTTKKVDLKNIFLELKWMLSGGTNIKPMVDEGCNIWVDWPHKYYNKNNPSKQLSRSEFIDYIKNSDDDNPIWGECGPVYGYQWRKWPSVFQKDAFTVVSEPFDQFAYVLDRLRNNPEDRRMIVNAWNAPYVEEMAVSGLPPCHVMFQFYTRRLTLKQRLRWLEDNLADADFEGLKPQTEDGLDQCGIPTHYIDCMMSIRSWDSVLGGPYNIAQYALLMHIMGHMVNMLPGTLTISSGDTHIYLNHMDAVDEQIKREPHPSPKLRILGEPKLDPADYNWADIELTGYTHHAPIKAEIAV